MADDNSCNFDAFSIKPQPPTVQQQKKEWPKTGLPQGSKKRSDIADLDHAGIDKFNEVAGARIAWSRAAICPCSSINDGETGQTDPQCPLCKGRGWFYFGPRNYEVSTDVGTLTPLQKAIVADGNAAVIFGLFQRGENRMNPYDIVGNWMRGGMFLTVRFANLLAFYDRIVNLDSDIVYHEVIEQPALLPGVQPVMRIPLRYRASSVNMIRSLTERWEEGEHFVVSTTGEVLWTMPPPSPGTRYTVHYCTPPTWLVVEHPHVIRETPRRLDISNKVTPAGMPQPLPLQARVELEFLPKHEGTNADD
jgi:hypothetical protein